MGLCTSCEVDTYYSHHVPCNNNNPCNNSNNNKCNKYNNKCNTIFSNGCQPYYTTQIIKPESTFSEYNEQSGYVTLPSSYTKPPPYNPNS